MMRKTSMVLLSAAAGAAITLLVTPAYRVIYNASDSAPRGWYLSIPTRDLTTGVFVFAQPPVGVEELAAERGYLPRGVPLLKQIRGTRGDLVCARDRVLTVNGAVAARALEPISIERG